MTTVALCMIVKDEELVIRRALESVKHLVDYICVCDTGSSDDTKNVIERFLEEEKIEEVWVSLLWTPTVKDIEVKSFLFDEIERDLLEEEN